MKAAPAWVAVCALLVNATAWGVSWWPFRQLDALGLHSLWATAMAMTLGSLLLAMWRRDALIGLIRSPGLWLVAIASGITNSCFNWAVAIGPVVRVVLLFYLMPIWAVLLARWLLREPLTADALARVGLALVGALVVLWSPESGLPMPTGLADWLGLAGGAAFALTNVMLRREARASESQRTLALFAGAAVCASMVAFLLAASGGPVPWPSMQAGTLWPEWLPGALGLAAMLLLANSAMQYGAARLPAGVTAVVMLSEVAVAAFTAAWLGNEPIDLRTAIGGALILGATLLSALSAVRVETLKSRASSSIDSAAR